MHTSDYITSLQKFSLCPQGQPNTVECPLPDVERWPKLDSTPPSFSAVILKTPAEPWTDSVTCHPWALTPASSVLPHTANCLEGQTQLPSDLLGYKRQHPTEG